MSRVTHRDGIRYGRLVAVRNTGKTVFRSRIWLCRCDCGSEIEVRGGALSSGNTTSCGCAKIDAAVEIGRLNATHGASRTAEYGAYINMLARCYNQNYKQFKDYGGRGIIVCNRWIDSFENFFVDLGPKPHSELTLERVDNDGNYEPGNCCWASRSH